MHCMQRRSQDIFIGVAGGGGQRCRDGRRGGSKIGGGGQPLAPPPDTTYITTNIDKLQVTLDKSICA